MVDGTSVFLIFRYLREEVQRLGIQIQFLRVNLNSVERSNTYSQYKPRTR